MKLSIITVNLNNRDGLKKTIDSVVSQTFRDFEWIVIDGGSTDGSRELIEHYADHFAYWVSEPDKGVYNAMNKGIKVANGEYLQFLNSGDWLYNETALERCFSHGLDADIIFGDLLYCNGDSIEKSDFPSKVSLWLFYKNSIGHNASFIRSEIIKECLYNESLKIVSDWEFFLKQVLQNKSFVNVNEIVSCFNMDGMSSVDRKTVEKERERVINKEINGYLLDDYKKMDEMENLLNDHQVKRVLEYGRKKKLYHRLVTGCLSFIELIDKTISRFQ